MVSGVGPGGKLRHGLAMAAEIHRRVNVNGQRCLAVSRILGLRCQQVIGVAKMTKQLGRIPSPERLALVVMLDSGLNDADVAEMFSRPERWARVVRSQADEIRQEDPIPSHLEWLEKDFQKDDPCVDEIYRRAAALRTDGRRQVGETREGWTLPTFIWDGRDASFV